MNDADLLQALRRDVQFLAGCIDMLTYAVTALGGVPNETDRVLDLIESNRP